MIESGLKQYQVAGYTRIPDTTISEYCLAQAEISQVNLEKLCTFFECEPDDILGVVNSPIYDDHKLNDLLERDGIKVVPTGD